MDVQDRSYFNFSEKVKDAFSFLNAMGFSEVEELPTLVRYRKDRVEVDIYHGRQSYEIGAGVTSHGVRYSISEIIRTADPEAYKQYRAKMATTQDGLVAGLKELSDLLKLYGDAALQGDPEFFSKLEKQRKSWSEEYALDVLARKLRPQANEAFRKRDYATAADLYSRIRDRLSPAELKKLNLAEDRRNNK